MNDTKSAIEREERYVLPTYAKFPFSLVKGRGCEVFTSDGTRFLDLYGGHAVSILGHSHPRWVEAVSRQAGELAFYSNVCYHPARAEAAQRIVSRSYPSMRQVYFANSGAEANETALKMARRFTGRSRVVAMDEGFHGRTIAALSVTGSAKLRDAFPDNLSALTDFVPFGDLAALERVDAASVAAVILEPIQSLAGVTVAAADYYRGLREFCTKNGSVLLFDEVQTAPGRTGTWFVGEHWGVEPDLVTSAKGMGGGFPVGVVVANEAIASTVRSGDQGSTFGGGPLACVAIAETLAILEDEDIVAQVERHSKAAIERLRGMVGGGFVRDVRGLGYLLGIECEAPARDVAAALRERGVLVGSSNEPNTFRLLPPLVLGEAEWEEFFTAFEAVARG